VTNGYRESDSLIVLKKPLNKTGDNKPVAEKAEKRRLAERNPSKQNRNQAQSWIFLPNELDRIRHAAQRNKEEQFISLWHHVYDIRRLRRSFLKLKRKSAPGIDGKTWKEYGKNLGDNLKKLSEQLRKGTYRARAVKRTYIPKGDGRQRPIGIPALEDKIVQRAMVEVLNAVYEVDFLGFSYGFRPKRSQHNALDAVVEAIEGRKVNWVLDLDIRGFFDAIDHEWLIKFVGHRIKDKRVIRHIRKWLNAGVMEEEKWYKTDEGTPQGGSISPLLANIYLHYVFDLWANSWRNRKASGDVVMVRFADDMVLGFQYKHEAMRFLEDLKSRFRKFNLEVNTEKTSLLEFGRYAVERRKERGEGKPDTFDFLGFTHICSKSRRGKFTVLRKTSAKKLRNKLAELKKTMRERLHWSIPDLGKWLKSVIVGHCRYYGVPWNGKSLTRFRSEIIRMWCKSLRRRSQKHRITWERMNRIAKKWLPSPFICHPYPLQRMRVNT
jgi:group II intron reverse transcriptase/maturase